MPRGSGRADASRVSLFGHLQTVANGGFRVG